MKKNLNSGIPYKQEFILQIINVWSTTGKKFNKGNVNVLKYAFITKVAWEIHKGKTIDPLIYQQYLSLIQKSIFPEVNLISEEQSQLSLTF